MKAVVWAAGYGTRLAPLTNNRQKCMLTVGGKPCLEYIVNHLHSYGIDRIITKVHHKPEEVMAYFGEKLLYHYQPILKDEEESLSELQSWCSDDFTVVINGDTITNVDIGKMLQMGNGNNVKFMDLKNPEIYAGTMILAPSFWNGNKKFSYYYSDAYWFDIGSFTGLRKARDFFVKR